MKVRVRDEAYDGNVEPVMVMLSDKDKENISNMAPEAYMYACFPQGTDPAEIERWMNKKKT